jgi:hypothetical protein
MWDHLRDMRLSAICFAALALTAASAAPASAFEPIEGVWRTETSTAGEYLIQQASPGVFKMTTIRGNRHCMPDEKGFRARVTEQVEIRGGGFDYAYNPVYRFPDCSVDGIGEGIVRVVSTSPTYRHVVCGARPGTGAPQFDAAYQPTASNTVCRFAVRIRPPKPPVRAASLARVPRKLACTPAARRRGRIAPLRLLNPANEPVLSILVKLGGRTLYRYEYPGKLRGRLKLHLPRRTSRLTVAVRTTSDKRFVVARKYGSCQPRRG